MYAKNIVQFLAALTLLVGLLVSPRSARADEGWVACATKACCEGYAAKEGVAWNADSGTCIKNCCMAIDVVAGQLKNCMDSVTNCQTDLTAARAAAPAPPPAAKPATPAKPAPPAPPMVCKGREGKVAATLEGSTCVCKTLGDHPEFTYVPVMLNDGRLISRTAVCVPDQYFDLVQKIEGEVKGQKELEDRVKRLYELLSQGGDGGDFGPFLKDLGTVLTLLRSHQNLLEVLCPPIEGHMSNSPADMLERCKAAKSSTSGFQEQLAKLAPSVSPAVAAPSTSVLGTLDLDADIGFGIARDPIGRSPSPFQNLALALGGPFTRGSRLGMFGEVGMSVFERGWSSKIEFLTIEVALGPQMRIVSVPVSSKGTRAEVLLRLAPRFAQKVTPFDPPKREWNQFVGWEFGGALEGLVQIGNFHLKLTGSVGHGSTNGIDPHTHDYGRVWGYHGAGMISFGANTVTR